MNDVIGGTSFQYSTQDVPKIIKVVGVGGGGGNAVTHMYTTGKVAGVSFLLCNTDRQALNQSPVPDRVVLGEGLGAGNKPEVGAEAAEKSVDAIRAALCDGETEMVFITAGMGGGTGTGASPVIGRIAREAGLLVVGIVTIPFVMEGRRKILKALKGVKALEKHVDALLVVNNEKLKELYPTENLKIALKHADETLTSASRGISDLINIPGFINLDFADVKTTLENSGVAIINTGYAEGAGRMAKAIKDALHSPLFNNNNVERASRILFNVHSPANDPVTAGEVEDLQRFIDSMNQDIDVIWGAQEMADLDKLGITVLASGFDTSETYRAIHAGLKTKEDDEMSKTTKEDEQLLSDFYGEGIVGGRSAKRMQPLILSIAELDNEDLLEELERTPAIRRSSKVADQIRARYRTQTLGQSTPQAATAFYMGQGGGSVSGSVSAAIPPTEQVIRPTEPFREGATGEEAVPTEGVPSDGYTPTLDEGDVIFFD